MELSDPGRTLPLVACTPSDALSRPLSRLVALNPSDALLPYGVILPRAISRLVVLDALSPRGIVRRRTLSRLVALSGLGRSRAFLCCPASDALAPCDVVRSQTLSRLMALSPVGRSRALVALSGVRRSLASWCCPASYALTPRGIVRRQTTGIGRSITLGRCPASDILYSYDVDQRRTPYRLVALSGLGHSRASRLVAFPSIRRSRAPWRFLPSDSLVPGGFVRRRTLIVWLIVYLG